MKRTLLYSFALVSIVVLAGCIKIECDCNPDHDPQMGRRTPVLFQYEYYNYAWGFRHNGFLIDNQGVIRGFDNPEKWIKMDSTGLMTEADLAYNLAQCDTICGTVDRKDLELYYSRIKDIRYGDIIDSGMVMADAGTGVLSAWYWNEKAGKYENVLLASNGDYQKINTHEDVSEIIAWMRWIGEKTDNFWWFGK